MASVLATVLIYFNIYKIVYLKKGELTITAGSPLDYL